MEDTARFSAGPAPWDYSRGQDDLARPAVLVVEDDPDLREMLSTLMDLAGFSAVMCETAEAGLNALREQAFDAILTDYALPRHSGLWLLEQAEAEGLILDTPVLIVTAHPDVVAGPYEVIQKPFDLDELVERVRYRLEGDGPRRRRRPSVGDGRSHGDGGATNAPSPVELILYVNSRSEQSLAAVKSVEKVLARLPSSRVKLSVHDLSIDPSPGLSGPEKIIPGTLVRRTAGPRTFIMGHITSPELLMELLADCEADQN
jgi:DNA-binding response OmpR family regulator